MKWNQRDRQVLKKKLNKCLLFDLSGQAASHKWNEEFKITGYTCVSKIDATTSKQCSYRAHSDCAGEEWYDWGLFISLTVGARKQK